MIIFLKNSKLQVFSVVYLMMWTILLDIRYLSTVVSQLVEEYDGKIQDVLSYPILLKRVNSSKFKRIISVLIITIAKFSNVIGYQLSRFQH